MNVYVTKTKTKMEILAVTPFRSKYLLTEIMTKTNSFSAKLLVGFVATAMLFTLSYTPARAATADELQAQITALMAQIAALQGGGGAPSADSCAAFTMDHSNGSSGSEVTRLQNFLIGKGYTIAAGATGYFGGQTQAALASFQSAMGIAPAAGYFGPITRAAVNGMCVPTGDDDSSDDDSSDDDSSSDDDDSSSDDLSGEASLDDVTANQGDDSDIEEGQEDQAVAEFDVEFADGDAKITRIDLGFVAVTAAEEDPWDTFDEISLWVDGDEVARMSASDEDDYLDEDDGTLRFSGLDIVVMEDEKTTITVGVSTQGSIDDVPATWRVDMEAMRFMDADDVSTTETAIGDMGTGNGEEFDIEVEGNDDEVIVKTSTTDPDSTTLVVDEEEKSDMMTIFAFDLDTDDSTNDIEVNEVVVTACTDDAGNTDDLISDAVLSIDGEEFDDWTASTTSSLCTNYSFDIDGDLVIDAGERVTAEFQVEFLKLTGNYAEGATIAASTTGATGDFEGADDVVGEGSATGDTHTLRSTGVVLEAGTMTETLKANTDSTTADDEGVFTIKFDVTAFEDDIWVNKSAASGTVGFAGAVGADYLVQDSSGNQVGSGLGTSTASLTSTADTDGTRFRINEGETETFTLTITFNPSSTGFFQAQLYGLNFATTNAAPNTTQIALPASDFQTDQLSI